MLIQEFYANKDILITGGTGFIGKAVIEKLLRSCSDLRNIFVLTRPKKGKSSKERITALLKSSVFNRLWVEKPEVLNKLQAIEGDSRQLGLGISADDMEHIQNVEIIIHSAATVRFDEPLRKAVLLNTRGTFEVMKIALKLKHLKAFLHISTAYANPAEEIVEEKVYTVDMNWRLAIKLAEHFDTDTLNILAPKIAERHPNIYTFSKNLSEQAVLEFSKQLPIAIIRPAMVISSLEEPVPGWIDNIKGPIGALVASALGLKRNELCNRKTKVALVPIDIVVRSILVAVYKIGTQNLNQLQKSELDVYNCAIVNTAPLKIVDVLSKGEKLVQKYPFEKTFWFPAGSTHKYETLYLIMAFFQQFLVAVLLDSFLLLAGRKTMFTKIQRLIVSAGKATNLFMRTYWNFKNEKFLGLEKFVCEADRKEFSFLKLCYIDYDDYFSKTLIGIRQFILNEPKEISTGARRRMKLFKILHYGICSISLMWLARFIMRRTMMII